MKKIVDQEKTKAALQIIRPELNIEKWPMFVPSKSNSKTLAVTKIFQQDIVLPGGGKQIGTVKKVPTAYGDLTTEDLVIYYALIAIWNEEGRPQGKVRTSLHRIAKTAGKQWGQSVAKAIKNSLYRLTMTTFIWEKSFYDAATEQTTHWISLGKDERFSILDDLHIHEIESGGRTTTESSYFRFHTRILKNLLENHTRPVLLNTLMDLKSDIAKLLYRYIDRIMAYKNQYERRSKELFEDLGLEGKTYAYPSKRKEKLIPVLKELQGVSLTTGTLTSANIKSIDGCKDFRVVFVKKSEKILPGNNTPRTQPAPHSTPEQPQSDVDTLIRYFHQQCGRKQRPAAKERKHVERLLEQYEVKQLYYLIDYAIIEAQKTNFDMRYFGGVLQYLDDAIAEYQQRQQRRQQRQQQQSDLQDELPLNDPQMDLERIYESLDEQIKIQIQQRAAQKIASHKPKMLPKVYQETLQYSIQEELLQLLNAKAYDK